MVENGFAERQDRHCIESGDEQMEHDDARLEDSDWDPAESLSDDGVFDFFSGGSHTNGQDPTSDPTSGSTTLHSDHSYHGRSTEWPWMSLDNVDDIRVFYLDRSNNGDGRIHGHFKTVSLNGASNTAYRAYSALSYAWGLTAPDGSHLTHSICVDGYDMPITGHLHAGLLALQQTPHAAFWIDAICIDQNNPAERSRQVMLMDKIYSNAKRLFVWLGASDAKPVPIRRKDLKYVVHAKEAPEDPHIDPSTTVNLQLRQRDYFKRRWVVQEVLCCRGSTTILIGDFKIGVTNLGDALVDPGTPLQLRTARLCIPPHRTEHTVKPLRSPRNRDSLLRNLLKFHSAQCSDERDRVYALKNISSDGEAVAVDYRNSPGQVFTVIAGQYAMAGHILEIFRLAIVLLREGTRSEKKPVKVPSWVPNWSVDLGSIPDDLDSVACSLLEEVPANIVSCWPSVAKSEHGAGSRLILTGRVFPPCECSREFLRFAQHYRTTSAKPFRFWLRYRPGPYDCDWCTMALRLVNSSAQPVNTFRYMSFDDFYGQMSRLLKYDFAVLGHPQTLFVLERAELDGESAEVKTYTLVSHWGYPLNLEMVKPDRAPWLDLLELASQSIANVEPRVFALV